jgi:hypothetical protein
VNIRLCSSLVNLLRDWFDDGGLWPSKCRLESFLSLFFPYFSSPACEIWFLTHFCPVMERDSRPRLLSSESSSIPLEQPGESPNPPMTPTGSKNAAVTNDRPNERTQNFSRPSYSIPRKPLSQPGVTDTSPAKNEVASPEEARKKMWNPFWLRTSILLGLLALHIGLLTGLILLWHFAAVKDGIEPRLSKSYYSWTYGPTAILVVVVSLWRQVDHECKALSPWRELQQGSDASRSLLLDYISPLQVQTFWMGIKNCHVPVIAGILGFGSLKLIVSAYLNFPLSDLIKSDSLLNRPSGLNANNSDQLYLSISYDQKLHRQLSRVWRHRVYAFPLIFILWCNDSRPTVPGGFKGPNSFSPLRASGRDAERRFHICRS